MSKKSNDSIRESVIVELPGKIRMGKCTNCGRDVSFLFAGIKSKKIGPAKFCPGCGIKLFERGMTKDVLRCDNCKTEIVDPEKTTYCTGCGRKLIYPEKNPGQEA
ncbi:hypothetical protein HYZ76_00970 [Candidatus Falkowbacteria bacterium]|nr:hypothetical protein [Candidatus Falkowbacteria bacterium]